MKSRSNCHSVLEGGGGAVRAHYPKDNYIQDWQLNSPSTFEELTLVAWY